jgi:RluA family pseudouridine synthase
MRLDQAIAARFPAISRRKARELLAQNRVLVNERPVAAASRQVHEHDRVAIVDDLPALSIIRRTDDWIAIDKPPGMPSQPARERDRLSAEELLRLMLKREGGTSRLFVVHRLDSATSGVLLFARNQATARRLSELFAGRVVRKVYLALVDGVVGAEVRVDAPIVRAGERTFATSPGGKASETLIRPLATSAAATLAEIEIRSGRTHQIRVHLASLGHPVRGDRKYGSSSSAPRLMLHAWRLELGIGELLAPLPDDFRKSADGLGLSLAGIEKPR